MFKVNEEYLLSEGNKDMGKVKIYNIVSKKNLKLKKRIHKLNIRFHVVSLSKWNLLIL